jgi:hypothetical protein
LSGDCPIVIKTILRINVTRCKDLFLLGVETYDFLNPRCGYRPVIHDVTSYF